MTTDGRLFTIPGPVRDLGFLLARVLLGSILVAHGWEKLHTNGLDATTKAFEGMGIPAAHASAIFATVAELVGGAMLVLGLLTPLAGLLVVVDLLGAWWFVHRGQGVFVTTKGWELVAALGLAALVFALTGPGRWSLDALIGSLRARAGRASGASRAD